MEKLIYSSGFELRIASDHVYHIKRRFRQARLLFQGGRCEQDWSQRCPQIVRHLGEKFMFNPLRVITVLLNKLHGRIDNHLIEEMMDDLRCRSLGLAHELGIILGELRHPAVEEVPTNQTNLPNDLLQTVALLPPFASMGGSIGSDGRRGRIVRRFLQEVGQLVTNMGQMIEQLPVGKIV